MPGEDAELNERRAMTHPAPVSGLPVTILTPAAQPAARTPARRAPPAPPRAATTLTPRYLHGIVKAMMWSELLKQ